MRQITLPRVFCFVLMLSAAVFFGISTTLLLLGSVPLGDFRGVLLILSGVLLTYSYAIFFYRVFLWIIPLHEGYIEPGSREEFAYHVYLLFYLVLFQPITRTHFIPVPLTRPIYLALGARLGSNSYSGGTLLDPPLTDIGSNCIIGHDALLFCHVIEGPNLSLARIQIGNNVTIGVKAVIMPGVVIADNAIIAIGAVVLKNTQIGPGEYWGGIPARRIR